MPQIIKANSSNISEIKPLVLLLRREDNEETDEELTASLQKAIENNLLLVAVEQERVVGYILGEFFGQTQVNFPNSIFISELFVLPEFRSQGIGKNLVRSFLSQKYPEEYEYFSLSHDPEEEHLSKYYENFGFVLTGNVLTGKTKSGNIMMRRARV
ncbi:MAG: GNAT family N-acetyltransferase [Patescibacteria group bacterium]